MRLVSDPNLVESPTHIVRCSGTAEYASVVSLKSNTFCQISWLKCKGDEDEEKIDGVNASLPDLPELDVVVRGKLVKSMSDVYLFPEGILSLEDKLKLPLPDAVYLQRISAKTRTFDMVCFYGKTYKVMSAIDKKDLDAIREWYPDQIFQCGADPLPLKAIVKQLGTHTHEEIVEELFGESSEEEPSEYEPDSEEDEDDDDFEDLVTESESEDEYEVLPEDLPVRKRRKI